jgi:hypothetical protein
LSPSLLQPSEQAATVFSIACAIGGWWYVRNYIQTGTISGLDEALMLANRGVDEKVMAVLHVNWPKALATILLSHVWYSGWSLLSLPRAMSYFSVVLVAALAVGLILAIRAKLSPSTSAILNIYCWFWLGQLYHVVMLFMSKGSSTAMGGWYLYSVVWAEVILGVSAIFALVPSQYRKFVFYGAIAAAACLDLYAMHFIALPYYAQSSRISGIGADLVINKAPGVLHRLDQGAFVVARRWPGLLVLNLCILQSRGLSVE